MPPFYMATTTDTTRQSKALKSASEKLQPETYGLDHDKLLTAHREQRRHGWSWASASKIKEEYHIPGNLLDSFHGVYGLPRLMSSDNQQAVYSLPALEIILETVPDLHDTKAGDTTKRRMEQLKLEAEATAKREMVEAFKAQLQTA